MAEDAASSVRINHYAHVLEKGFFFQWFKFICVILVIYIASRILQASDDYPIILRILAAHIPAIIYLFIVENLPRILTKLFGANRLVGVADDNQITLYLEDCVEIPLEDLKSIEFGSASYFKRWQLPFLKNRIKAQYRDRELVIPTRVDYAPLFKFIHELNRRLPGE